MAMLNYDKVEKNLKQFRKSYHIVQIISLCKCWSSLSEFSKQQKNNETKNTPPPAAG